ncbi:MAG: protein kinase [Nannocystaceae bacterium]
MSGLEDQATAIDAGRTRRSGLEPPTLLAGRYQILDKIGEGGMGLVYRGYDLDLEEVVAIKLLRGDLVGDDSLRARFRREVKLARRVTHHNVARVFEFGRDGDLCFLTMEYIDGPSLHARLRADGPLPLAELVPIARTLCQGLAAAHAAGVVHGDIKPGNVLVSPERGAVLTDFGIAQALTDTITPLERSSSGTPRYMAPEQARAEPLGPETDIYAIGVLLYEALTADDLWPVRDAHDLLRRKRAGEEPDLEGIELPPGWLELIRACLATDRSTRPADAPALLARLDEVIDAPIATTQAHPPSAPLAPGAGMTWIELGELGGALAEDRRQWIREEIAQALAQTRGLRVSTANAGPAGRPRPQSTIGIDGVVDPDDDGVAITLRIHERDDRPALEVSLRQPRMLLHVLGRELASRIAAALHRAPAIAAPREPLDDALSDLYVRARLAYARHRHEESIALFDEASARAPDNQLIRLGRTLAQVQSFLLFKDASEALLAEIKASVDDAVAHHDDLGEAYLARARLTLSLGDTVTCARSLCAAITRAPSLVEAHTLLADLLIDIGRLPDAERRLDIALALDPTWRYAWVCRARLRAYQGRWTEFYGVVEGPLKELRFRTMMLARLMHWHPDRAAIERFEEALRDNVDEIAPSLLTITRQSVAFVLGREDRRHLAVQVGAFERESVHLRRNAFIAQVQCELWCALGEVEEAWAALLRADRRLLCDYKWMVGCPLLDPVRAHPGYAEVRDRVRARADAIAEAIWG